MRMFAFVIAGRWSWLVVETAADIDFFVKDAGNLHGSIRHDGIEYMMVAGRTTAIAFADIGHILTGEGMITDLFDQIQKLFYIHFGLICRPALAGIARDTCEIASGCPA